MDSFTSIYGDSGLSALFVRTTTNPATILFVLFVVSSNPYKYDRVIQLIQFDDIFLSLFYGVGITECPRNHLAM
jgi:hypothetical protein